MTALTTLLAWMIEVAIGWPDAVYRWIRHPVVWIGALISGLERPLNREPYPRTLRLLLGATVAIAVVSITWIIATAAITLAQGPLLKMVVGAVIGASLLASRSLYEHVAAVAMALTTGDLSQARSAVAHIVGRDPSQLDEAAIARAAIESLAENASDGVIAPLFWGVLLGPPGLAAYKSINTLDSMIGHRNARYEYFGKCAARLDDVVNWIPARLTGALFVLAAKLNAAAWQVMWRDSNHHRSVNAGWPEAAMAGALQIRLSGPRQYADTLAAEPWLNEGAEDPDAASVERGLQLYVRAMGIAMVLLMIIAFLQVGL
ncbi:MAG: adenosylcobinamide-phosphate synthase CbiB [Pseudomonadota bacterium]